LLINNPIQPLPILYLIDNINNTRGLFLNLLESIFKRNIIVIGNYELNSKYNAEYLKNLIICCKENINEKIANIEKIKALSTADKVTVKEKGLPKYEVEFHGKFILLGKEDKIIHFSPNDQRVWYVKISEVKYEDLFLSRDMEREIPIFINYLKEWRQLSTKNESRLWFNLSSL
jgi:hypothetical protein